MSTPAIWIGLGAYGARAVAEIAGRGRELEGPPQYAIPRPSVYWSTEDVERNGKLLGPPPRDLEDAIERALPDEMRRGNMRGPCYQFVVAHATELVEWSALGQPDHWLWSLPHDLYFSGSRIVLIACTDQMGISARDRGAAEWTNMACLEAAVQAASQRNEGFGRVLTIQGTGRLGEARPTSQQAIGLLGELVSVLEGDPISQTLGELLGTSASQPMAPAGVGSAESPDASQATHLLGGYTSFGIKAVRYDVTTAIEALTQEIAGDLGRTDRDAPFVIDAATPALDWRPDILAIPTPEVPFGAGALKWSRHARFSSTARQATAEINDEEARIAVELPTWWEAQVESSRADASASRAAATGILDKGAAQFEGTLRSLWEGGSGMGMLREYLAQTQQTLQQLTPETVLDRAVPPPLPSFARPIDRLRAAVATRPSVAAVALAMCPVAGAAGLAGYGLGRLLVEQLGGLSGQARDLIAALVIVLAVLAVGAYPTYAWLVKPWQAVTSAERSVRVQMAKAALEIQNYRSSIAAYVLGTVQAEVIAQFAARLDRASKAIHDYSRALDDISSEDESEEAVPAEGVGVLETLVEVKMEPTVATGVLDHFHRTYVPEGLIEDRSTLVPVSAAHLRGTIHALASDAAWSFVTEHPLTRESIGNEAPHPLGPVQGEVDDEAHVFGGAAVEASEFPGSRHRESVRVEADLSRPDRAFWLVSAPTRPVNVLAREAVR